jgi:hypothetical protein
MAGTVKLPDDNRTLVYRAIVEKLRLDGLLSTYVATWITWDGDANDSRDLTQQEAPIIRLTPQMDIGDWIYETTQYFELVIEVEALIPGLGVDELMNLQGAIENALYTPWDRDTSVAFSTYLMQIGANSGIIGFRALNDPDVRSRKDGSWLGKGQITIDVNRTINP